MNELAELDRRLARLELEVAKVHDVVSTSTITNWSKVIDIKSTMEATFQCLSRGQDEVRELLTKHLTTSE